MKMRTLVILLDPAGMTVYSANRRQAVQQASLPCDESSLPALRQLCSGKGLTVHLLVDLPGESFRLETVPKLGGADREALFARKLQQAWPDNHCRHARAMPGQNGQEELLLSALTDREWPGRIMALLNENRVALAGIHSVALATADLLRQQKPGTGQLLLTSLAPSGGLRQSCFTPAGLRLSRHGHLQSALPRKRALEAAGETRQLYQYLLSLHQLDASQPLQVMLLADAGCPEEFCTTFLDELHQDAPALQPRRLPLAQLAGSLRLPACADWHSLLVLAIANGRIGNHYAPAEACRHHRLQRLGTAINSITLATVLAGVTLGWYGHSSGIEQQARLQAIRQQLAAEISRQESLERELQTYTDRRPVHEQDALQLYRHHLAGWPDIEPAARAISRVLAGFPLLVLDSLDWHARTTPSPASGAADQHIEVIGLAGHIDPACNDPRSALAQLQQFIAGLATLPGSRVTLDQAPLDIRPQGLLASADAGSAGHFTVRIVVGPAAGSPP